MNFIASKTSYFFLSCIVISLFLSSCKKDRDDVLPMGEATFESILNAGGNVPAVVPEETVSETMQTDSLIDGAEWMCSTKRYRITDGNEDFPLFNPNAEVIYPGNLLQGGSLDQATPDVIVVERAGGTISYDLINDNGTPSFSVDQVTLSSVRTAMNNIIVNRPSAQPANFTFTFDEVQSQEQLAFNMGVSVKTLATKTSGSFNLSTDRSYSRYLVKLNQSYYTMSFDLPTSLDDLFAPNVTPEDLAPYVGPNNPATYISSVTYGRIFYMLIEATEISQELSAAISASFNGVVTRVDAEVDISALQTMSNLRVKVVAFGGDAQGTFETIGEINLATVVSKLGESSDLTTGVPVSYTVRNVSNNQTVAVKLNTEYDVTNCTPADPGFFNMLPLSRINPMLSPPYTSLIGDVNGDQKDDLILSHSTANLLEVQVALGSGTGTFSLQPVQKHPVQTPAWGTWTDYAVKLGDINGDGRMDLVYNNQVSNNTIKNNNATYLALAEAGGKFDMTSAPAAFPASWGNLYKVFVGDVNGDQKDDLIWNELKGGINRTYTSISNGTTLDKLNGPYDRGFAHWPLFEAKLGDVNGDGRTDMFWKPFSFPGFGTLGLGIFTSLGQQNGSVSPGGAYNFNASTYPHYDFSVGDVNGDGRDDVVMTRDIGSRHSIFTVFSEGNSLGSQVIQTVDFDGQEQFYTLLGDMDKDGRSDLIWNDRTADHNTLIVGLGSSDGAFTFPAAVQKHPLSINWTTFEAPLMGDINGDGRTDLIWIDEGSSLRIAIAMAKP
ncbi:MAG: thiol-activated cytolysin family protein [Bacteroidota bacterium]